MIRIARGGEPKKLATLRIAKMAALSSLGREPTSDDIVGYREVAEELWNAQHHKCCYCEQRVPQGFNDVEHYRPKCRADRRPGCTLTHGYWWLAFSWDNLLFACPACNRSGKSDLFPLTLGSVSLLAKSAPPGNEHPLLLDPGSLVNPVEHIEYVENGIGKLGSPTYWWARPRSSSIYGNKTIEVCDLNRPDLRELRNNYFRTVIAPQIKALNDALEDSQLVNIGREFRRAMGLLDPENIHVGFTYDALRASVPDSLLRNFNGLRWPLPSQVC
jgi:hypothetical protein